MSPGVGAEGMARLRRAVAEIEARSGPAEARAPAAVADPRARFRARRRAGGRRACTRSRRPPRRRRGGDGLRAGARRPLHGRAPAAGLIVGRGFRARELGALYGPGLVAHGLELGRLVFVRAPDAPALFQAMEDALKSGAPAVVVGEVWSLKNTISPPRAACCSPRGPGRRRRCSCQASAYGAADQLSSAAETRFEIAAAPSAHLAAAGGGRGLPGRPAFAARLVKARLSAGAGAAAGSTRRGSSA